MKERKEKAGKIRFPENSATECVQQRSPGKVAVPIHFFYSSLNKKIWTLWNAVKDMVSESRFFCVCFIAKMIKIMFY